MATDQSIEQNKDVARRALETLWRGEYDTIDDLCAAEFVGHDTTVEGDIIGPEGIKEYFRAIHAGLSETDYTINEVIAEGDRVVTRGTSKGMHSGELNGIPASNKAIEVNDIVEFRFKDGKIVESWAIPDGLSLMQQVGVIPEQGS
ncbi:ester cyclase [Haladaptatus sp. GCM10025707]|uniref:ester cyclase n=1 Tax=unclassified Haladaptatus TaxID=2622732 RepID=UPI0023E82388|nr:MULTISPECIES: ester cyclase [unclassified Haladaptatus]